jgi:hypothetical protein
MPHSRRSRASGQAYTPRTIRAVRPTRPPDAPTPNRPLGSVTGIYGHHPLEPAHDVPTPMLCDIEDTGAHNTEARTAEVRTVPQSGRVEHYQPKSTPHAPTHRPSPHRRLNRRRAGECRAPDDLPRMDVDIVRCAPAPRLGRGRGETIDTGQLVAMTWPDDLGRRDVHACLSAERIGWRTDPDVSPTRRRTRGFENQWAPVRDLWTCPTRGVCPPVTVRLLV